MSNWSDDSKWNNSWSSTREIGQGGQGTTKYVTHNNKNKEGCLKVLSRQGDQERRLRFFREATAYDTCQHPLIPRLISSNAHLHDNLEHKLFIVTEYIPGPTLSEYIDKNGPICLEQAIIITIKLLDILDHLHEHDWIHRDIKPDNIILKNEQPHEPVLLDFGLCHKFKEELTQLTEYNDELGNRFLRLPDLSIGSLNKRDTRTDLTFAGGIFLYVLTGLFPATLSDTQGKMPHQREEFKTKLSERIPPNATQKVLKIFDSCFSTLISDRVPTAAILQNELQQIISHQETETVSDLTDLEYILEHSRRASSKQSIETNEHCKKVHQILKDTLKSLLSELGNQFKPWNRDPLQLRSTISTITGCTTNDNNEIRFTPKWSIEHKGSEIVISSTSGYAYRLDAKNQNIDKDLNTSLRSHFLSHIRELIDHPYRQVTYRGFFKGHTFHSIQAALKEASKTNKLIFLVVFDEKHQSFSELDHALGYFMEYENNKNIVHENFITAITPLSESKDICKSEHLETVRWHLIDKNGHCLSQDDVYANPKEGARTLLDLVNIQNSKTT